MDGITYEDVKTYFSSGEMDLDQALEIRDTLNALHPPEESQDLPYWIVEDNPEAIQLGEETIQLIHRGRTQLQQLGLLKDFLRLYATPLINTMFPDGKARDQANSIMTGITVIMELLEPEALVQLGRVITLKDTEFVEEHFDIGWIIDGGKIILDNQPTFRKLTSRFFGKTG